MQDETIQMSKKINQLVNPKDLATALRANLTKRKQQVRARQHDPSNIDLIQTVDDPVGDVMYDAEADIQNSCSQFEIKVTDTTRKLSKDKLGVDDH